MCKLTRRSPNTVARYRLRSNFEGCNFCSVGAPLVLERPSPTRRPSGPATRWRGEGRPSTTGGTAKKTCRGRGMGDAGRASASPTTRSANRAATSAATARWPNALRELLPSALHTSHCTLVSPIPLCIRSIVCASFRSYLSVPSVSSSGGTHTTSMSCAFLLRTKC